MGIIFKQRVQNPTIKDLRSFVRKTVTRDRSMYETDSQYDNETTFINRQRDQLKDQFGWLWDMEDEALVHGEFGHLKITDSEISFKLCTQTLCTHKYASGVVEHHYSNKAHHTLHTCHENQKLSTSPRVYHLAWSALQ